MDPTPRLAPLPPKAWPAAMREALAALRPPDADPAAAAARRDGSKGLNALGTFAHHPELTRAFFTFNGHVLFSSTISPRHARAARAPGRGAARRRLRVGPARRARRRRRPHRRGDRAGARGSRRAGVGAARRRPGASRRRAARRRARSATPPGRRSPPSSTRSSSSTSCSPSAPTRSSPCSSAPSASSSTTTSIRLLGGCRATRAASCDDSVRRSPGEEEAAGAVFRPSRWRHDLRLGRGDDSARGGTARCRHVSWMGPRRRPSSAGRARRCSRLPRRRSSR